MSIEWVSAECDACGWVAKKIMKEKAKNGTCPYCKAIGKLRPR